MPAPFAGGLSGALKDGAAAWLPTSAESTRAFYLVKRWLAPEPLRICDDDQCWKSIWQQLTRSARQLIAEPGERMDASEDDDLPGFQGWTAQGTPIQDV